MQNAICPHCDKTRADAIHLQVTHNLSIPTVEEICKDFSTRGKAMRSAPKHKRRTTIQILEEFERDPCSL